jgi:hypothetical protein
MWVCCEVEPEATVRQIGEQPLRLCVDGAGLIWEVDIHLSEHEQLALRHYKLLAH